MKIILAGIIGRHPWGGVAWCGLMYLLGLRALGHEVYYLEDTLECNFDPDENALATNPRYALAHIDACLRPFGLGDRWRYVDYTGRAHGMEAARWKAVCKEADLFLVLSGGCWIWRDEYLSIPRKAFIDSDPAFTQLAIHKAAQEAASDPKKSWYLDFFRTYDRLFTFGGAIGTPNCDIPTGPFHWLPTWQPVCCDIWTPPVVPLPPRNAWSTVMTWRIDSFKDIGGNKAEEFPRALYLANRCREAGLPPLELAVNGPTDFLRAHGWNCVDAQLVSRDLWRYHQYIRFSRGEFGVAKHTYVASRCGWFSDRTECYLASGRPAVVQDTGFSALLPTGSGLFAWSEPDEAFEAIRRVESDYARHSRVAREIALEHFDARKILPRLVEQCR